MAQLCTTMTAPFAPKLVDLPNFGEQLGEDERNFRWPKKADIEALNLCEPQRLKCIKTKGVHNDDMTSI